MRRNAWNWFLVLLAATLLTVCTGGVGWAQTIDLSKPFDLARMTPMVAGGGAAAAGGLSCTNGSGDSAIWTPATYNGTDGSSVTWKATKIVLSANSRITKYTVMESDEASDTGNTRMVLFNHDAVNDYPDETSEVANSAITKNATDISSSRTTNDYVLASPLNINAGTYWLVHQEQNSANVSVYYTASTGNRVAYTSDGGTSWRPTDNYTYNVTIWGCQ